MRLSLCLRRAWPRLAGCFAHQLEPERPCERRGFHEPDCYDYFRHDPARHALIGSRTGQMHRLGDIVAVRLVEAAPLAGALRFELVSETAPRQRRPRPAKAKRARRDTWLDFESPLARQADSGAAKR